MLPKLAPLAHLHPLGLHIPRKLHRPALPLLPAHLALQPLTQQLRIERRLARTGRRVRPEPGHRVPDQQHLAVEERIPRCDHVRDGLDERLLRVADNLGELRREGRPRVRPLLVQDLRPHCPGREGDRVALAVGVGHQVVQLLRALGVVAVPDPVDQALAGFQGAVFAGDDVGEDLGAAGVEEGEFLDEGGLSGGGGGAFGDGPAPGDVAGVLALNVREQDFADGGAWPVGSND